MAERHAHAGPGTARALADIRTAERELVGNLPIWTPAGLRGASCEPRWARRLTSGCTDGSQIVLEHPVLRADTLSGTVRGPKEQQDVRIPLDKGLCGAAATSGKTVVINDVANDPRYLGSEMVKSNMVAPILIKNQVVAELDIESYFADTFTKADQEFIESCATLVGRFMEKSSKP